MHEYLLQHYADRAAAACSEATALWSPDTAPLSWGSVVARANQLAHCLRQLGVARHDRVACCLAHGPEVVVAVQAILRADCAYVPIDLQLPSGRVRQILDDCQPHAVLCDAAGLAKLQQVASPPGACAPWLVAVNAATGGAAAGARVVDGTNLEGLPVSAPPPANLDGDLAYILYTSGSTGTPKGVMVTHANVRDYIDWAVASFAMLNHDRIFSTAPFHCDMFTFDLHAAAKTAGCLCLASRRALLFPAQLLDEMEASQATVWKGVSSLLMYLARAGILTPERIPQLRTIMFGGERLPPKYLAIWQQAFPAKEFVNMYGPTEATGVCAFHRIGLEADIQQLPIGQACGNAELLLLDSAGQAVPLGELGEIWVRGRCLSLGYWRQPELTAAKFQEVLLSDGRRERLYRTGDLGRRDAAGNLVWVGRNDNQVKIMGHRIELEDVESVLLREPGVQDAAVVVREASSGVAELVAFVELGNGATVAQCRQALQAQLPSYMHPKHLISLDRLPRTDRGKVDRIHLQNQVVPAAGVDHADIA